jgi:hypothetical protein
MLRTFVAYAAGAPGARGGRCRHRDPVASLAPVLPLALAGAPRGGRPARYSSKGLSHCSRRSTVHSLFPPPNTVSEREVQATFGTFFLPGPTEVRPEVLAAMTKPMIGHRVAEMEELMAGIQPRLRRSSARSGRCT